MFKSAQIKLTAWYLAIVMVLTLSFSAFVYIGVTSSAKRALLTHQIRLERQYPQLRQNPNQPNNTSQSREPIYDEEALHEIQQRILLNLLGINLGIALVTGSLGYVLAGITLKPIKKMVEKQKRFISDAAHEFKTPLTAMKAEMEVTLRDKNLTKEDATKTIKSSIEEVDKLQVLTESLLKESRFVTKKQTLEFKEIKVKDLIKAIINQVEPIAKKKDINISLNGNSVLINGHEDSFNELFTILIENAIKYTNKEGKVIIDIKEDKNNAIVKVKDNGIGISEDDLANIFDRFYRADQSRSKSKSEGFGLGLSIAKEVVKLHKGEITVESETEIGTTFTVKLPK